MISLCLLCGLVLLSSSLARDVGVTDCSSSATVPSTSHTGTSGDSTSGRSFLIEDGNFMFTCCGVVRRWQFTAAAGGTLTVQIWRRSSATSYKLVSEHDVTAASGANTVDLDDNERMSFQNGDYIGWYSGSELVKYSTASTYPMINRYASIGDKAIGGTNDWSSAAAFSERWYDIRATVEPSTVPYFKNLPAKLVYADTDLTSSGVTIRTLSASDADPNDASTVVMSMNPQWTQYFTFTANTGLLTTALKLTTDTYLPVFMVEEQHCGKTATATLTVIVTDTAPTITNLPAYATITEDVTSETLLYTVSVSDVTSQWIWCKGSWTIGSQAGGNVPFIVKMISASAGTAGVYLIEWPQLDYSSTTFYSLTVNCYDTADNLASGSVYVSVTENEKPVFTNIGASLQINASMTIIGTTIYTVSTTDSESDQVKLTYSLDDNTCPIVLFYSGEVRVTETLYLWQTPTTCVMTVTASDTDNTNAATKTLTIYIVGTDNLPVFVSPVTGSNTVSVAENMAVGTSIFKASATDSDTYDTLAYTMTIDPPRGWAMFSLNEATGVISTHASNTINYDVLSTAERTPTMSIMVHDGKTNVVETLTITVTNVNEAPVFNQNWYYSLNTEGASGTSLQTPGFTVVDPDSGDTTSFTLNCGSDTSKFTMATGDGSLTYNGAYALATGISSVSHQCTVTVTDSGALTATTTLTITVTTNNNNAPVFSPASYSVSLSAGLVVGTSITKVTATDADSSDTITYTLDQSSMGDTYLFILADGTIYVAKSLIAFSSGASYTVTVSATDTNTQVGTASLSITFPVSTTTVVTTTDRRWEFMDDPRNVSWITFFLIFLLICLSVIFFIVYRYLRSRKAPLINCDCLYPSRFQESDERWNGTNPDAPSSIGNSSNRVSLTNTEFDDEETENRSIYDTNEPFQLGRVGPVLQSRPPAQVVSHARTDNWEYFDPSKLRGPKKTSRGTLESSLSTSTSKGNVRTPPANALFRAPTPVEIND